MLLIETWAHIHVNNDLKLPLTKLRNPITDKPINVTCTLHLCKIATSTSYLHYTAIYSTQLFFH